MSPTVSELQNILHVGELALWPSYIDLIIEVRKIVLLTSISLRIDVTCQRLYSPFGSFLSWMTDFRYLATYR